MKDVLSEIGFGIAWIHSRPSLVSRLLPSFLPLPLPSLSFFGSRSISPVVKTENPVPRSFFAPKPNGNAYYAGYTNPK